MGDMWGPSLDAVTSGRTEFAGLIRAGQFEGWVMSVEFEEVDADEFADGLDFPLWTTSLYPLRPQRIPEQSPAGEFDDIDGLNAYLTRYQIDWYSPAAMDDLENDEPNTPDPALFEAFDRVQVATERVAVRDAATARWLSIRVMGAIVPAVVAVGMTYVAGTWWLDDNGESTDAVPEWFLSVWMTSLLLLLGWSLGATISVMRRGWTLCRYPWRAVAAATVFASSGEFVLEVNDGRRTWRYRRSSLWELGACSSPTAAWFSGSITGRGILASVDRDRLVSVRR